MARVDDYKESFRLACVELKQSDPQHLANLAGAELHSASDGTVDVQLSFLGSPHIVRIGHEVEVIKQGHPNDIPLPEKILICHYLLNATGEPPTGQLITFRQVPDGHFYFDAFQRRARDPFLATFGCSAELFRTCAQKLGGEPVETGDVGMTFQVFPRISIQLVLWQGDDEFPPEASILFDASIQRNLPVEDIAVLSGMVVYRLMGISRSL